MGSTRPPPPWEVPPWTRLDLALLAGCWAAALVALLPDLGHAGMAAWDEAMHQLATRSTLVSPWRPFVFETHLSPVSLTTWWVADTWLHKPPLPYWVGGLLLRVLGMTPLALRLVSLAALLGTQALVFALARRLTSPVLAALAAGAYGLLPFGWQLVQGVFFGDVHDIGLAFWNTLAVWGLVRALETGRRRHALLAGAAVGLGYLTKSMLALTPLGVAGVLTALGLVTSPGARRGRALSLAQGALVLAAAVAVAAPWDLHAFRSFPELYRAEYRHVFRHLDRALTAEVGGWERPADAVFFELLGTELYPLPQPTAVLAAVALAVFAFTRRHPVQVTGALWVWATLLVNSAAVVKVPAQVWGAVPGLLLALALLVGAGLQRPGLGLATLLSLVSVAVAPALPGAGWLGGLARAVPLQLHTLTQVLDGYALTLVGGALLLLLVRQASPWRAPLAGAVLLAWLPALGWQGLQAVRAHLEQHQRFAPTMFSAPFRDLGLALAATAPPEAVLWLDAGGDLPGQFNGHTLMFWSGRLTYVRGCDVPLSVQHGRVPLLVSPRPEPLKVVAAVPGSPVLAYDCREPAPPPPPPPGLHAFQAGPPPPAGYGVSDSGGHLATWSVFLPRGAPPGRLHFVDAEGRELAPPVALAGLGPPGEGAWTSGWALGPAARPGLAAAWAP